MACVLPNNGPGSTSCRGYMTPRRPLRLSSALLPSIKPKAAGVIEEGNIMRQRVYRLVLAIFLAVALGCGTWQTRRAMAQEPSKIKFWHAMVAAGGR